MADLRAALDRLTDQERHHILNALATRLPAEVEREAAYMHEWRVWYPHRSLQGHHQGLTVTVALDTSYVPAARRADVTVSCTDCGHPILHTSSVPVTATPRQEAHR